VPDGWRVVAATAGAVKLAPDDRGTVDLTALRGQQTIRFQVERR
jgi:urease beta subunit